MANPRKFSEKIALHNQKQAEETAEFERIMREVLDVTSKADDGTNLTELKPYTQPETIKVKKEISPKASTPSHTRESRGRTPGGPMRNRQSSRNHDTSPYGNSTVHLIPPMESNWHRSISDSAIHQSLCQNQQQDATHLTTHTPLTLSPTVQRKISNAQHISKVHNNHMTNNHHNHHHHHHHPSNHHDNGSTQDIRSRSSTALPRLPGINIYPSQNHPDSIQIPIPSNTGSLPDLTSVGYPSMYPATLDQEYDPNGQNHSYCPSPLGTSPSSLSPTSAIQNHHHHPHPRANSFSGGVSSATGGNGSGGGGGGGGGGGSSGGSGNSVGGGYPIPTSHSNSGSVSPTGSGISCSPSASSVAPIANMGNAVNHNNGATLNNGIKGKKAKPQTISSQPFLSVPDSNRYSFMSKVNNTYDTNQQQSVQQQHQQHQQQPQAQSPQQQQQQQQQQKRPQQQQQQQGPPQQQQQQQQRPQQQQHKPAAPATATGGAVHRDASVASTKSSSSGDGTLQTIEENLGAMRIAKEKIRRTDLRPVLVRRGAHGKRGEPVSVEANFFRLLLDKLKGTAYHYDVAIEPERPKKFYRPVFAQFCRENYPGAMLAFDGQKNAYTTRKLSDKKAKVVFQPDDGGKQREYTVQVKEAAQLDLGVLKTYMKSNEETMAKPMSAIQCLDVVLRSAYENNPNFVRFKRAVYAVPRQSIDIGRGHELWFGLFQSALLGSRPYLNVDVSHKAFPMGAPVLKVIGDFNRGQVDQVSGWVQQELHSFLKGMDVVYTNPTTRMAKRMRCNGLREPASQQMFKLEDGTRLSVADYFARKLNFRLRYPNLPVLHVGSTVRSVYVPAELCDIPAGQALNKNNPEECTRDIIRYAATSAPERKRKILYLASQIQYNKCPTLLDFGITVGNEFEKVPARIIDAPPIEYARGEKIRPQRGVWRAEGKNFIVPSTELSKRPLRWRILNLDSRRTNEATVKKFGEMLQSQAMPCNVQMEPFDMAKTYVLVRDMRNCLRDIGTLLQNIKREEPAVTIVVLPSRGDAYAKVKQKAELASERIGLLTQCVKGMTVAKKGTDMSTLNNIMLKINAKTNGTNHCISQVAVPPLGRGKVMYIGADVTHPLSENEPSVVGVAALYDLTGFRYNCSVRLQGARDEMIRDLENIVQRQLLLYKQYNGALPERIMYYRDGVSDGQFAEILTIELQALHAAIARVEPGYKPAVTFIVVQKRHHTRFFPQPGCPTEGKNGNVPPGTIVDSEITTPDRYEFYLVSHAAVQGVAKPTKYVVLYDDSNCHPDSLQALTYNLCHLFARCNRAVSYPAPTYYAHLAAYRGRVYIKDRRINMNDLENAYRDIQIIDTVNNSTPMFFV